MENPDLAIPEGLSPLGRLAAQIILELLEDHQLTFTGGCRVFYTPKEWADRGEDYCTKSELVVVYDGAAAKYLCSLDGERYDINEAFQQKLRAIGLFYEEGTHWYGGVYRNKTGVNPDPIMLQVRGVIDNAPLDKLRQLVLDIADRMYHERATNGQDVYVQNKEVNGGDLVDFIDSRLEEEGFGLPKDAPDWHDLE